MTNKILALKYRPQRFDNLLGQNVIAETIINSIKSNKIPNAYLFTGIRGVGKTTTARIVAKSLNCLNGIENLCGDKMCENCDAITNSNHIDVLEMDAASKTSVDDVRDLIEFSRYGPTSSKYKIFIIDEVHMLSKQAFNALLKTLEEPPEYLKFIFATTEIKKIPITVVSRCQKFDLSRIKSSELLDFLKNIKDKENGKVSDEALKLIVKISEGSVRDALSLLDRGMLALNKDKELENYLRISPYKFGIYLFNSNSLENLYKEELAVNENGTILNLSDLKKFLDKNIFKIEKLNRKFVENIVLIYEVHESKPSDIAQKIKSILGDHPTYLTFDIDCLDPAFAPGTGTPVWGGLSSGQAAIILRDIAGINLIGGDIVEVSPPFDPTGATAVAGAHVAMELIALWCWNKRANAT